MIHLQKNQNDYDLSSRRQAMNAIETVKEENKILTGIIYLNEADKDTHGKINSVDKPLNSLETEDLCPGSSVLDSLNESLR